MSTSCLTLPILPILHVQNEIFLSKVLITILPALPDYLFPKNTDSMPQDLPYLAVAVVIIVIAIVALVAIVWITIFIVGVFAAIVHVVDVVD